MAETENYEIELKLGLIKPCTDLGVILSKFGTVSGTRVEQLENVYYDTKDKQLFAMKAGLRIRRAASFAEQTLKLRGSALGGIHSRSEYNVSIGKGLKQPDLKLFPPEALRESGRSLESLQQELEEQCSINFKRVSYDFVYQNCEFEISVDEGEIKADQVNAPILELEIELKKGPSDKDALFTYFDELLLSLAREGVPLTLEPFSKMHRAALLMDFTERNTIELPETPAGNIGTYIRVNLRTFETLLGLFLVKHNPVYLGYMAYTLKCVRRSYDYLLDDAELDENVNFSESFKELKHSRQSIKRILKRLAAFLKELEAEMLEQMLKGQELDLEEAAGKVRCKISKLQAYCLPLHLRALLLKLETVKMVNQKA